jgi:anti-anti-sigma factor
MTDPIFDVFPLGDRVGLRLVGELDMATAPKLQAALAMIPPTGTVTLELGGLSFIDSTGLHVIVRYAESLGGASPLVLRNASASLLRLLAITKLDEHPHLHVERNGN